MKEQHNIELDLNLVTNEALKVMAEFGQFSKTEMATAEAFYSQLIKPEVKACNSYKKNNHKKKNGQEFVLPDKMALGFVSILGGSLICLLPFGITQGIGSGLIGTGIYCVLDGVREGEKPYYIDSETRQPINQTPSPSIGVGTEF